MLVLSLDLAGAAHLLDRAVRLVVHTSARGVGIELGHCRRGDLAGLGKLAPQLLGARIGVGLGGRSHGPASAEQARDREPGQDCGAQRDGAARVRSCSVRVRHEDDTILRLYSLHFLPRPAPTFPRGARDGGAA